MAIDFGTITQFNQGGGADPWTWAHTQDKSTLIFMFAGASLGSGDWDFASIKWNGVNIAWTKYLYYNSTAQGSVFIGYLLDAAQGAYNLVLDPPDIYRAGGGAILSVGGLLSYRGVAVAGGSSTAPTVDIATASGDLVLAVYAYQANPNYWCTLSLTGAQTLRYNKRHDDGDNRGDTEGWGASLIATGTPTTMAGTFSLSHQWGMAALAFLPSHVGGSPMWWF